MMRKRYVLLLLEGVCAAGVLLPGGCGVQGEVSVEFTPLEVDLSAAYRQFSGPMVVTSAIGAAAPPGGCGVLSALSIDAAWRTRLVQPPPGIEPAGPMPSMFEPARENP